MVRDVVVGLQEVFLQGTHNEGHRYAPCMEQPEVMNQVVISVMNTMTSQQQMKSLLFYIQGTIQDIHLALRNSQCYQEQGRSQQRGRNHLALKNSQFHQE